MDGDGSGEIEYGEFHNKYGDNQAAGALVRRHMAGTSGETETINIRGRNNRKVGMAADYFDTAGVSKQNFHPGHADHVAEHRRLSGESGMAVWRSGNWQRPQVAACFPAGSILF